MLFAETSFFDQWGNAASVLGFLSGLVLGGVSIAISLWGFTRTHRMQEEIKKATEDTIRRVAVRLAASEMDYLYHLVGGARDADAYGHRELVVFRCHEGSAWALMLSHNPHLEEGFSEQLRGMAQDLEAMAHYMGKAGKGGELPARLAAIHSGKLRAAITALTNMVGRMKHAALETSNATARAIPRAVQELSSDATQSDPGRPDRVD
jgi:hypothetical protein